MDLVSRQAAIEALRKYFTRLESLKRKGLNTEEKAIALDVVGELEHLASAQPYTDEEIQKMQEIEQAQIQKAFALGREDALSEVIRCKNCKYFIRSNASNATVCNKHDGLPYTVDGTDFCSRAEWKDDENYK